MAARWFERLALTTSGAVIGILPSDRNSYGDVVHAATKNWERACADGHLRQGRLVTGWTAVCRIRLALALTKDPRDVTAVF